MFQTRFNCNKNVFNFSFDRKAVETTSSITEVKMSEATNETNKKPLQALVNAVTTSKLRLVRLLIEGGVHVDVRDDHGQTPLLITCSLLNNTQHCRGETREKVAKYLISAGADVNAYDVTGRTPLIYAVITRASVLSDLMAAGADPWWEDGSRKCAFDYAIHRKDIAQVQIIVDGCKRRKMREIAPDIRDTRGILRDVIDARESRKHIEDATCEKQDKKSTKKKAQGIKKNRKRLAQSRNISSPGLTTFSKSTTDKSPDLPPKTSHDTCDLHQSTSNIPTSPSQSTDNHQLPEHMQLCGLCKSIFIGHAQYEDEERVSQPFLAENVNSEEDDYSLYRRGSSGSLYGLTEKRYESIRRKSELGITLEDLFSSTDINQPGKHPLYVKSPRTNTMIDISSKLLVPERARSLSVSLPPLDDTRLSVESGYPRVTSAKSAPHLHIMAWSQTGCITFNPESRVYHGSDDECDDDIIFPAIHRRLTSSPTRSTSSLEDNGESHHDMTSPFGECTSLGDPEPCNSPIPTIVLTDSM